MPKLEKCNADAFDQDIGRTVYCPIRYSCVRFTERKAKGAKFLPAAPFDHQEHTCVMLVEKKG